MSNDGYNEPADRVDALVALLGAALLCALYLATFQVRQYGDASLLMPQFLESLEETNYWGHVLYFPAAWALLPLVPTPIDALVALSSLAGALAGAFAFLLARLWGAGRAPAAVGALLFAFSPGAWFFSTTIEVHTLHAACVGLCALVTTLAPWRRPVLAALLVAATLPLLFLSHQTGILLGPGFVLLAQAARVRSGSPPFSAVLPGRAVAAGRAAVPGRALGCDGLRRRAARSPLPTGFGGNGQPDRAHLRA